MKARKDKKLQLSKDTVKNLQPNQLAAVAGGLAYSDATCAAQSCHAICSGSKIPTW